MVNRSGTALLIPGHKGVGRGVGGRGFWGFWRCQRLEYKGPALQQGPGWSYHDQCERLGQGFEWIHQRCTFIAAYISVYVVDKAKYEDV